MQILKKEAKIKDFREYLVDKDVILSMVKYLLAMRGQQPWPEDPQQHLTDFYGEYRSPLWDEMDIMKEENAQIE